MAITTLVDFRDYIKRQLGADILCVEVSNDQIDDCIENACSQFLRYMYGEGLYEDYMIVSVSANVSAYSVSGIEDVVDTYLSRLDGINTLFSPTNMLMYNDWLLGNAMGGQADLGASNGMILTNYETAMMFLAQVNQFFGLNYTSNYRRGSSTLVLTPTPKVDGSIMLKVYKRESAINLYNHILVKNLAVGLTKKVYGGMNLGKYNVTMPGGGTVNYQFIYDQGKEESELALEAIRSEGNPMPFLVG